MARIIRAAETLRGYRWTLAETRRFDQPGSEKAWTFVGPGADKGTIKDGKLAVDGPAFLMHAPLPKAAIDGPDVRIDLWLEVDSSKDITQRVGVFVGKPPAGNDAASFLVDPQTAYYEFCHGETGKLQQFVFNYVNPYEKFEEMPWGKPVHVSFELNLGGNLLGQRDGCQPLECHTNRTLKFDDSFRVGLRGRCGGLRLIQMSVRLASGSWTGPEYEKAIRLAGFADQIELDGFISSQVVDKLTHRSYRMREQASQWLRQMQPLSMPAIKAAVARSPQDGELGSRLQWAAAQMPPPARIERCKLDEAPPGYAPPASSQSEKP